MFNVWYASVIFMLITKPLRCRSFQGITHRVPPNRVKNILSTKSSFYVKKENIQYTSKNDVKFVEKISLNGKNNVNDEGTGRTDISQAIKSFSTEFCKFAPFWTVIAAFFGIQQSTIVAPTLGSLYVMQTSLSMLMLAMGLTITPKDFGEATKKPLIVITNVLLCFGMMPYLAIGIASILKYNPSQTAGIVLLGSVSGGQASNLFALLAGGDVALSIVCTLFTTFLGVLAIPLLMKQHLQTFVAVDFISVLQSVSNLVLLPLLGGLGAGKFVPSLVQRLQPYCPVFGVLSTLVLVAGGAANSSSSLGFNRLSIIGSCLLPILGGFFALVLSYARTPKDKAVMDERSRRTLVVETLSKSPTLAYVLARKHIGESAATVPAAGMISLAVIGAIVATIWPLLAPTDELNG